MAARGGLDMNHLVHLSSVYGVSDLRKYLKNSQIERHCVRIQHKIVTRNRQNINNTLQDNNMSTVLLSINNVIV